MNVAVTATDAESTTVHVPVPLHAPPHPANVCVGKGFALSTTVVPFTKCPSALEQASPQLIDAGAETTVPCPLPALVNESVRSSPIGSVSAAALFDGAESLTPPGAVIVAVLVTEPVPVPLTTFALSV